MNHREFKNIVISYLTGELDEETTEHFEMHFFRCNDCREYLLKMRAIYSLTKKFYSTANLDEISEAFSIDNHLSDNNKIVECDQYKSITNLINNNAKRIVDKIKQVVSDASFPVLTYSYYVVKGKVSKENIYHIGEKIVISIEVPSEIGGYLTVLHYDDNNDIRLVFPKDISMENKAFKPDEKIKIGIEASPPTGTHYLKAFITKNKMVNVDFNLDKKVRTFIALSQLLKYLSFINKGEWIESICSFEVIDT